MWFSLLRINGGRVQWDYWNLPQGVLTQLGTDYNLTELIDWAPPYERNWGSLKILLKAVASYTSRGNFEAGLDDWLNRPIEPAEEGDLP